MIINDNVINPNIDNIANVINTSGLVVAGLHFINIVGNAYWPN